MSAFDFETFWQDQSFEHLETARRTFETLEEPFAEMLDLCVQAVRGGGKLLFFGNGGSAADAQHLATELSVRYAADREPIPALALTTDTSVLTAIGNDYGFEHIFARQIDALGAKGDVAVGISTSGNSENVLLGLKQAQARRMATVGLTGRDGGRMEKYSDVLLIVPSDVTARIQEMHITLGQMLCGALEQKLGLV